MNINLESKFEELENVTIDNHYVNELITDCKVISIEMLKCLIKLLNNSTRDGYIYSQVKYAIEKAIGKSIDEVLK